MPRHFYEGAEETVQGFTGLLLEEGEAVSYGRLRFVGGRKFFQGRNQDVVGGGWGGEAPGNALGEGAGKQNASTRF